MDNDQIQGSTPPVTEEAVEEKQPEPMPSSNQTQTEEVDTQQSQNDDGYQLPEEASDRTRKQFEKLLEENKKLKSQVTQPKKPLDDYGTSVFDSFHPQAPANAPQVDMAGYGNLNQQQVDTITSQFVDDDGNVDVYGLNKALAGANTRAQQAEMRASSVEDKFARFEENQQAREAHSVFPELDPKNENFNASFFELARDRLLRNMYEGKSQTLLEVANEIKKSFVPSKTVDLDKVKNEAVAQYKESQASRNQGPLESGVGESRLPEANFQELRDRTQRGDFSALDERLRAVGVIKPK